MASSADRLPELYARALELDAAGRERLFEDLAAEDPAIGAQLEALLAAGAQQDGALERSPWQLVNTGPGEGPDAPLPERVGPYPVLAEIGRGGMGRVFLARQAGEGFERQIALKVLATAGAGPELARRFREESRILAGLEHPGIARFYDAGRDESGTWYLALEYVEGEDLLAYAANQRLGLAERLRLFLQVLDAVEYAHRRLVVHRDLKPSNLMVDRAGRARLLDFGISRIVDPEADDGAGGPRTEVRALTPAYASPEQLRGERATTAADVYSLGIVLYELLCGRRPFAESPGSPLVPRADRDPPPPSSTAAPSAGIAAPVPRRALEGDLDAIVLKALRSEPEQRYRSAADFAADLRRWLAAEPVAARRGGRRYRLGKFVARHRLEVGAAAGVILALLAGTALAVAQARVSARERDRALAELRRAEITNDFSGFLLSESAPTGETLSKSELLLRGEEMIHRRFAEDPASRVHLLLTLSERYYENSQFDEWRHGVGRAFDLSRGLRDLRLRSLAGCMQAVAVAEAGDHERAAALFSEALHDLAREPDSAPEEARCRVAESGAAFMASDIGRAVSSAERALELERARAGPRGREREALGALANAYAADGRFAAADRTFRELVELLEELGLDHTTGAANYLNSWAVSLQAAGQHSSAVALAERAVALERELDAANRASPNALATLASALSYVGRHVAAIDAVEEAVTETRAAGSPLAFFWTLGTASRVFLDAGRAEEAERRLREMQAILRDAPAQPIRYEAALTRALARFEQRRGDAATAARLARTALARLDAERRPAREVLPVLLVLASALNANGELAEAGATAERAQTMARDRLGEFPFSHDVGQAALELGLAQTGLGDIEPARDSLRTALTNLRESSGDAAPETLRAAEALARLER